ncbi:copper amine oxidase N-terminal domain-containing protein [Brevibacillus thermoruber]|uniref:copper amine oxidase N-terminal domain-containing protein n=1 Tax=Brevibacillus thermoruber TaxID=33942 RepID=UPI0003F8AB74|nr:copper amine oxidase N-terminal domain-containing protein [Brevibacillus thermoruber]
MKQGRYRLATVVLAACMSGWAPSAFAAAADAPLTIQVNGAVVETPAGIHAAGDQLMVPLRWTAEQLGATVEWEPSARAVIISRPPVLGKQKMLDSYRQGLTLQSPEKEKQMCPIPAGARQLRLPDGEMRPLVLHLKQTGQGSKPKLTVSQGNDGYVIYDAAFRDGRVYVLQDWLEELFRARVQYDKAARTLSIQTPQPEAIEEQIAVIEQHLVPSTPDEAVMLWGRGEQTRSGALQYAALSPELRKQLNRIPDEMNWVTGVSSPWVGPITVKEKKKLSETAFAYTVTFPEITSAGPPYPTATEQFVVERLSANGTTGWYITDMVQASPYGLFSPNAS